MTVTRRVMLLTGCAFLASCGGGGGGGGSLSADSNNPLPTPAPAPTPTPSAAEVRIPFSFANGADGFTADFAGHGVRREPSSINFISEARRLPAPLDHRSGLLLGGNGLLFMYAHRPVTGLVPGQRYRVRVDVSFATNVPVGCVGAGGSPGESVGVYAGAMGVPPEKRIENESVVTNIDMASASAGGRDLIRIGDFAGGGGTCGDAGEYRVKSLTTALAYPAIAPSPIPPDALLLTADSAGRAWIVIGTASGFMGRTEIYYLDGAATFTPV